jgi:hypothetical protein
MPGFERSLRFEQQFEIGRFTVLFGKNNAGKTNVLEDIYLMLATKPPSGGEARIRTHKHISQNYFLAREGDAVGRPVGALYVDLEPNLEFDRTVLNSFPDWEPVEDGALRFGQLPPRQVCYASTDRGRPELWFTDVREFYEASAEGFVVVEFGENEGDEDFIYNIDEQQRSDCGPIPRPLFLGWEFHEVDTWVTSAIAEMTTIPAAFGGVHPARTGWLESVDETLDPVTDEHTVRKWRIRPEVDYRLEQLASLATDLLPDFLDGEIRASLYVPTGWRDLPEIRLSYHEGPHGHGDSLEHFGRGASRWMGIAVQVALRLMEGHNRITSLDAESKAEVSGHVLFVDEPEAHLHHSAVASIIRWCHRMIECGFNVLTASHHEEFLRASGDAITFVKVTRDVVVDAHLVDLSVSGEETMWKTAATRVRTIPTAATSTLQELADEVGMHPAAALSLHRAILFVEGPLDEAVLDEYAGPALDAAGVTIIPIHGTKNLEGLIDGEFTTRLGIKTGVLTDNTNTVTMWDRSNNKRKEEEKKLVRLIKRFEDQGLPPPTPFGVLEDDLLFALPTAAISSYINGPFPGWRELREECRVSEGAGLSDSVDWKSYAYAHYRLPITTADGVRRIIRALDLAGVELPSIQKVVDEIIAWAARPPTTPT